MAARCPICTDELEDVDAVRRHTLVVHGQQTKAGPGDWSPPVGGPPGEPGWRPDPWNASALRFWDGGQWSGRVAPLGAAPPEAEPKRSRAPGPTGGPAIGLRAAAGLGAVFVAAIVMAVVLTSSHGSGKGRLTAGPPATLPPVPTTATGPGNVGLGSALLTAADAGGGWSAKLRATAETQQEYSHGPCASPLWAHDVAGQRTVLVNGGGGLVQSGEVIDEVREAQSTSAANDQAAFVTSPSYVTCAKDEVVGALGDELSGTGVSLGQVSIDPLNLDIQAGAASRAEVFTVGMVDPSVGQGTYFTIDHVDLFEGPYEATVEVISDSIDPLPNNLVQQEASVAAERLAQLPPGGTLHAAAV